MRACLSLQQVLSSLLRLQCQEQAAGFAIGHVTAGAHVFCWAQNPLPELRRLFSFQPLGSIHGPTSSAQTARMLGLQTCPLVCLPALSEATQKTAVGSTVSTRHRPRVLTPSTKYVPSFLMMQPDTLLHVGDPKRACTSSPQRTPPKDPQDVGRGVCKPQTRIRPNTGCPTAGAISDTGALTGHKGALGRWSLLSAVRVLGWT